MRMWGLTPGCSWGRARALLCPLGLIPNDPFLRKQPGTDRVTLRVSGQQGQLAWCPGGDPGVGEPRDGRIPSGLALG